LTSSHVLDTLAGMGIRFTIRQLLLLTTVVAVALVVLPPALLVVPPDLLVTVLLLLVPWTIWYLIAKEFGKGPE
jgi:hypothetical protein